MYEIQTKPSLVLEDDDEMGVNAPLIHQRVISKLHVGLGVLYYHRSEIEYEPLTETMLGEGVSSPTPDLLLYDNGAEKTRVIIEVCQTRAIRADVEKVIRLIEGKLYGIEEGFIYNYKTGQWLRYRLGDNGEAIESSFSLTLNLDLAKFL